ncbi:MAG: erythromycin esterase family protein [Alphaproteobacteria bacterium]|nr:erythromycin esterase family protein [Alphaproteobacteria bacterium]
MKLTNLKLLTKNIIALNGLPQDYAPLLDKIKDAQVVLLGSASHGTNECYQMRAEITQHLIKEKGFHAIAIEGDWTAAYKVNTYIKNKDKAVSKYKALASFDHFPSWMWCNKVMLEFITWLRAYNDRTVIHPIKIGLYGLDLYSLDSSIHVVLDYLDKLNSDVAAEARKRYQSLYHHSEDPLHYALSADKGLIPNCSEELLTLLVTLLQSRLYDSQNPILDHEELLFIHQNAKVISNAENYYRLLLKQPEILWNFREEHMVETLEDLRKHYQHILGFTPKIVVWAHNMHVANVASPNTFQKKRTTLGQLIKKKYQTSCYTVGFTIYTGEVTTASQWGGFTENRNIRPAPQVSYESIFHQLNLPKFLLFLDKETPLPKHSLQRAMGVIYRENKYINYYYTSYLSLEYNVVIHIDVTTPLIPLHEVHGWKKADLPRTYPTGF